MMPAVNGSVNYRPAGTSQTMPADTSVVKHHRPGGTS